MYLYLYICIFIPISISLYFSLSLIYLYLSIIFTYLLFFFKGNGSHNCGGLVSQHLMGEAVDLGGSCNSSSKAEFLPVERRVIFVLSQPSSD